MTMTKVLIAFQGLGIPALSYLQCIFNKTHTINKSMHQGKGRRAAALERLTLPSSTITGVPATSLQRVSEDSLHATRALPVATLLHAAAPTPCLPGMPGMLGGSMAPSLQHPGPQMLTSPWLLG